eukprot:2881-Amphidinium_carterae.1
MSAPRYNGWELPRQQNDQTSVPSLPEHTLSILDRNFRAELRGLPAHVEEATFASPCLGAKNMLVVLVFGAGDVGWIVTSLRLGGTD